MFTPRFASLQSFVCLIPALLVCLSAAANSAKADEPPARRPKGSDHVLKTASPQQTALVAGNTRFGLDLYARLASGRGNLFFSPSSISTALAMTYAGAQAGTAREMAETLHFPGVHDDLPSQFHALISQINGVGDPEPRKAKLLTANALWLQRGDHFLPEFLATARNHYLAALENVDFKTETEAARQTINHWVEQQTQDKIKELLKPSILTADTTLVLTNAVYFKSQWATPFQASATRADDHFTTASGEKIPIPMMSQRGSFNHFDGGSFQMLEIPYALNELSMVVLLPKTPGGLPSLEASLSEAKLKEWAGKLARKDVVLEFPRFKLTESFNLAGILAAMGMPSAFSFKVADFSGITGKRELAISDVIHQAYVDVNEEGTEAAAATAVVMMRASAIRAQPISFRADHPFVFFIRDQRTGTVLFLGRLATPK